MNLCLGFSLAVTVVSCGPKPDTALPGFTSGILYTNYRVPEVPWSAHVVMVHRDDSSLELQSVHARGGALGLSTLSEAIPLVTSETRTPLAGLNGDFYQRDRAYAGDPRGLQIVDGELISGPSGGVSFWIDASGQPHATNVASRFEVTGSKVAPRTFGLNEDRGSNAVVLYTPAVGGSTRTRNGRELILEREGAGPWLPLRIGSSYTARVREARDGGDAPLSGDRMVLSFGPAVMNRVTNIGPGAILQISTQTWPDLRGASTAISGGPVLARRGKLVKLPDSPKPGQNGLLPYEFRSMAERHPRSAIGWNQNYFFLVQVDGRQKDLSVGMTLEELGQYMVKLGCKEVMNLDGGGSATLWYEGRVRNSPCDGRERDIANALVVTRKETKAPEPNSPPTAGN